MQHKKHSNSLSLLQSNLNRVHNQHQTLRHLLQQTAIFKKVGQQLQTTEQISNKIMNLKEELQQEIQMQEQSVEQSNKIRQMQQHIHQVKQQLKHIRKEQENKRKHEEQQRRMEQIEAQEMIGESFAEVEDHVREYLLKLKHRMEERHSKRFEQHASTLVQDEENKYKKDLEAEIGWVLCDLEFAQFRDISPNLPVTQTQSQGEMQRQILDQELGSYTREASGRLEYELKVLRHQLKQMGKCARWQGKVPTEHFTHKLQSLQGKFHRLQQEREGFQHRTYLETQKLKVLDEKLTLLNPNTLPKHPSTQQLHPELHYLEQECQAQLQQLSH